jgi:hypothetical protein
VHNETHKYLGYPPFEFPLDIISLALECFQYWCIGASLPPIELVNLVQGNNNLCIAYHDDWVAIYAFSLDMRTASVCHRQHQQWQHQRQ